VMNVTDTYPPKEVKGCIISGLLTPRGANYIYPAVLKETLDSLGYIVYRILKMVQTRKSYFKTFYQWNKKGRMLLLFNEII